MFEQNPCSSANLSTIMILNINIRSLRHKASQISDLADEYDISCVTETYLNNNVLGDEINIPRFCVIERRDRREYGGSVAIYVSKYIKFIKLYEYSNSK